MYIVLSIIVLSLGLLLLSFPNKVFQCINMSVTSLKIIGCRLLGFVILLCGVMAIYAVISGAIELPLFY